MANAGQRDTVLVTGAAGFIGFHVTARLLRERIPVLGIDNFDPAYDRETKEENVRDLRAVAADLDVSFEFAVQDICRIEPEFASGRLCGVVHLAAKTGVRTSIGDVEAYVQTNVIGTLRILELCRAQGIDRLLFASSSSVYGDDTPPPFSEDARADRSCLSGRGAQDAFFSITGKTGIWMDVEMGVMLTSDIDEKLDRIGGEAQ